jgi:nitrate/nitrite transport system substrate-binding protein
MSENHTKSRNLHDPYDPDHPLTERCACGGDHSIGDHGKPEAPASVEEYSRALVEAAAVNALFPHEPTRRAFIKAVGRSAAMAAVASAMPIASLQAMAQERGSLERNNLKIGFISITCAAPLIMAEPLGHYRDQGLKIQLVKTGGWGLIRDKIMTREHDASHFLSPMPLAMTLGLGSDSFPTSIATIQNNNGQAITLHLKHKRRTDPKQWKGFTLAVPFVFSMHNFLLRYYLADFGVDPDTDVKIVAVPPAEMVGKLTEGAIDGFLGPDPFNQRAVFDGVGFIHILSKEIWDGHPCCAFGASDAFIQQNPNTFAALFRAVIGASLIASISSDRTEMAKTLAPQAYLNQPVEVLTQVFTGQFPDGLGHMHSVPDRLIFNPVPWHSMAVWMLTQMKRWGYIKGDVNYAQIAEKVFRITDAKRQMEEAGWRPPEGTSRKYVIMAKTFDPAKPEEYLKSFKIQRT